MLNLDEILFVVLTCDEYIKNRVESIKNSWGKDVSVVYLTDTQTDDPKIIGYNTPKDYDGIQDKYYEFFINYDFSKYNFYFFLDDDTFVNLKNLKNLSLPEPNNDFCIGRELHLNKDGKDKWGNFTGYPMGKLKNNGSELPLIYPSGGSGFIISKSGVLKIQNYLKNIKDERPISGHSDVSIGFWIRGNNIKFISSDKFWWDTPNNLLSNKWESFTNELDAITFHYVKPEMMLEFHSKYNIN